MNRPVSLPANSPFLTVREAAALIGCSTHHVYVMCQRDELKHAYFGNALRINKAALLEKAGITEDEYLATLTTAPAAVAVAE